MRQRRVTDSISIERGSIRYLHLDLNPECTFDLNKFLDTKLPPPHYMTFGQFDEQEIGGRFYADCLTSCGNAYDPSVYEYWQGPHVSQFLEVTLEAAQEGSPQ